VRKHPIQAFLHVMDDFKGVCLIFLPVATWLLYVAQRSTRLWWQIEHWVNLIVLGCFDCG
jgi:hypothetical protein